MQEATVGNELHFRYTKILRVVAIFGIIIMSVLVLFWLLDLIFGMGLDLGNIIFFIVLVIVVLPQLIAAMKFKVIIGKDQLTFNDTNRHRVHIIDWEAIESVELTKASVIINPKPTEDQDNTKMEQLKNKRNKKKDNNIIKIDYAEKREMLFQEIIKRAPQAGVINHKAAVTG